MRAATAEFPGSICSATFIGNRYGINGFEEKEMQLETMKMALYCYTNLLMPKLLSVSKLQLH